MLAQSVLFCHKMLTVQRNVCAVDQYDRHKYRHKYLYILSQACRVTSIKERNI